MKREMRLMLSRKWKCTCEKGSLTRNKESAFVFCRLDLCFLIVLFFVSFFFALFRFLFCFFLIFCFCFASLLLVFFFVLLLFWFLFPPAQAAYNEYGYDCPSPLHVLGISMTHLLLYSHKNANPLFKTACAIIPPCHLHPFIKKLSPS